MFWRHGYDGASLAMLTKAMGIKPPSLYAAFGSKEGLLKAALDRYAERRSAHMRYVLAGATAREVAERFLTSIAESHTDPANPPGCLLVQGGLACGEGSENIPFELASRRAQSEPSCASASPRPKARATWAWTPTRRRSRASSRRSRRAWACWPPRAPDREALREVARVSLGAFPGRRRAR